MDSLRLPWASFCLIDGLSLWWFFAHWILCIVLPIMTLYDLLWPFHFCIVYRILFIFVLQRSLLWPLMTFSLLHCVSNYFHFCIAACYDLRQFHVWEFWKQSPPGKSDAQQKLPELEFLKHCAKTISHVCIFWENYFQFLEPTHQIKIKNEFDYFSASSLFKRVGVINVQMEIDMSEIIFGVAVLHLNSPNRFALFRGM